MQVGPLSFTCPVIRCGQTMKFVGLSEISHFERDEDVGEEVTVDQYRCPNGHQVWLRTIEDEEE